jgi:hypothetical protein
MTRKIRRKPKKVRPVKPAMRHSTRRPPHAAKRADVIDTLIEASARALALPIRPPWRTGIKRNLQSILTHAALVDQFSLPDEIEPAPVFRA